MAAVGFHCPSSSPAVRELEFSDHVPWLPRHRPVPPSMSREQIDSVAKSVETLLMEAKQIRNRCKQQNADARILMEELRQENCELVQRYQQAEKEMEQVKKALGELMATKAAFDARERQLREAA